MPRRGSFSAIFEDGRAVRTGLLWVSFFLELLLLYLLLNWLPTLLVAHGATRNQAALAQIGFNLGGVVAALATGVALEGRLRNPSIVAMFVAIPVLLVVLAKGSGEPTTTVLTVLLLGCAVLSHAGLQLRLVTRHLSSHDPWRRCRRCGCRGPRRFHRRTSAGRCVEGRRARRAGS